MPNDLALREPAPRVPSYRRHKPSGQAVVTLSGRDVYLGPYGGNASRAEYDRLITEWLAAGRSLPRPETDLTVAELAVRYLRFAKGYYRKDGYPTGSLHRVKVALRLLRESYARTGPVWKYVPESHKTDYRGMDRAIFIGPKAQAVLGHSHMKVSEIYAERNLSLAEEIMRKIG